MTYYPVHCSTLKCSCGMVI